MKDAGKTHTNRRGKVKTVECPECRGTGEYEEEYDDGTGNSDYCYHVCAYCDGEGKVESK